MKWSDRHFLYSLMEERMGEPEINISHQKMPSWKEHLMFMLRYFLGRGYRKWYVITDYNFNVGAAYLTKQNEVGIHILKSYRSLGIGAKALNQLTQKHRLRFYLANINPRNKRSMEFFEKHGFNLIQHVYRRGGW